MTSPWIGILRKLITIVMTDPLSIIMADIGKRFLISPMADITAYRDLMQRYDSVINVPELRKNNATASALRLEGNRLFQARKYDDAMLKYNESICFAETGSEDLAIGYANRSAVYYAKEAYEFALCNISLARKNHCPERLMPKLTKRELSCREKIDIKSLEKARITQLQTVKDVNPRIPFLAKGISLKELPEFGRGLVAEKDFEAGDVILNENPLLACIDSSLNHTCCRHCAGCFQRNLIPCPNCVYYMYCSEECLEMDTKFMHRFECGIAGKLSNLSSHLHSYGAKFFFYGLTLFGDDIEKMAEYYRTAPDTGGDPFIVDYTKYDPMKEFKEMQKVKAHHTPFAEWLFKLSTSLVYNVYMKNPVVRSLVTTKARKEFLLECFLNHLRFAGTHAIFANERQLGVVCPIASLVNHSCDPNAVAVIYSGRVKLALLRPVRKGEQICYTYGTTWWKPDPNFLKIVEFSCACVVCKTKDWESILKKRHPQGMGNDSGLLTDIFQANSINVAAKFNAIKQYVKRYAHIHPEPFFAQVLQSFREVIVTFSIAELLLLERAKAVASII